MPPWHLMVEGKDDWHVVRNLLKANGYQISEMGRGGEAEIKFKSKTNLLGFTSHEGEGGVSTLLDSLPTRLKQSDLASLAVVVDADETLSTRWDGIRAVLTKAGCASVPKNPVTGGTFVRLPSGSNIGIWLMPDNQSPGMLEDFVTLLVPTGDSMLPHADKFVDGIPPGPARYKDVHRAKARIHAWLAVQESPGKPLGLAVTARFLDPFCSAAKPFLDWFERTMP